MTDYHGLHAKSTQKSIFSLKWVIVTQDLKIVFTCSVVAIRMVNTLTMIVNQFSRGIIMSHLDGYLEVLT